MIDLQTNAEIATTQKQIAYEKARNSLLEGAITHEKMADYLVAQDALEEETTSALRERKIAEISDIEDPKRLEENYWNETAVTTQVRRDRLAEKAFIRLEEKLEDPAAELTETEQRLLEKARSVIETDLESICVKLYIAPEDLTEAERDEVNSHINKMRQRLEKELPGTDVAEKLETYRTSL
jgi:aspartate oxidase